MRDVANYGKITIATTPLLETCGSSSTAKRKETEIFNTNICLLVFVNEKRVKKLEVKIGGGDSWVVGVRGETKHVCCFMTGHHTKRGWGGALPIRARCASPTNGRYDGGRPRASAS